MSNASNPLAGFPQFRPPGASQPQGNLAGFPQLGFEGQGPAAGGGGGLLNVKPPLPGVLGDLQGAYAQLGKGKIVALGVALALVGVVAAAGKQNVK